MNLTPFPGIMVSDPVFPAFDIVPTIGSHPDCPRIWGETWSTGHNSKANSYKGADAAYVASTKVPAFGELLGKDS